MWVVLGFTDDMIVGAWQDWRLARDCTRAWHERGCPPGFDILQGPGEGDYIVHWYVGPEAAKLLDDCGVAWRAFAIGERAAPPPGAREALVR